ncbi:unnamed protein product [Camellia sinensis]
MSNVWKGSAMKVDDPHLLIASQFNIYLEKECSSVCKSEVDRYLADRCEASNEEKFDILRWWKVNSSSIECCPKLHVMSWQYPSL